MAKSDGFRVLVDQFCPKCNSNLLEKYEEKENPAGDFITRYLITKCHNPECDYTHEEAIGGYCNPSWTISD